METEKSEKLNTAVHVDHHCPTPPHVFSHIFCGQTKKKKKNSTLSKKNIISILQMRQQTKST